MKHHAFLLIALLALGGCSALKMEGGTITTRYVCPNPDGKVEHNRGRYTGGVNAQWDRSPTAKKASKINHETMKAFIATPPARPVGEWLIR